MKDKIIEIINKYIKFQFDRVNESEIHHYCCTKLEQLKKEIIEIKEEE